MALTHRIGLWSREPLLHFLGLGALLFGLDAWISKDPKDARELVLTAATKQELGAQFQRRTGRAASTEELRAEIDLWARDEALYAEALRLGLDRDDPGVRSRLIAKLRDTEERLVADRQPTDTELEALLAANHALYESPLRFEIEQVFVSGRHAKAEARARLLAKRLAAGEALEDSGDSHPLGRHLQHRGLENLKRSFGESFAAGVEQAVVGSFIVLESRDGWHAVRVVSRAGGEPPSVQALRPRLTRDFQLAERRRQTEARVREIAQSYRVVER